MHCLSEIKITSLYLLTVNVVDTNPEKGSNINYISTRSRNITFPYSYYNTLPVQTMKLTPNRKNPIFDFHIKKIDDSSYEKMVIE